ncbi:MAG: hypothetical protein L6Q70_02970, partial [Thauera sp.]|nr:hypothetical protein [Thauera sp.]
VSRDRRSSVQGLPAQERRAAAAQRYLTRRFSPAASKVSVVCPAGLVNPVAGVVTYLAQKVLSDPIEKLFAFEYAVTGTWSDPQVAKRGAAAVAPAR